MADVKISDLPALSVNALTGNEAFIVQEGNTNSRVLLDTLGAYLAGSIVGYSDVITLDGSANNGLINNYVDLFTPATGKIIKSIFIKADSLTPTNANVSVVLHDGDPLNDVELVAAVSAAELNIGLSQFGCNGETVASGYLLKLLVTDNTITGGTILVVANYLI